MNWSEYKLLNTMNTFFSVVTRHLPETLQKHLNLEEKQIAHNKNSQPN